MARLHAPALTAGWWLPPCFFCLSAELPTTRSCGPFCSFEVVRGGAPPSYQTAVLAPIRPCCRVCGLLVLRCAQHSTG